MFHCLVLNFGILKFQEVASSFLFMDLPRAKPWTVTTFKNGRCCQEHHRDLQPVDGDSCSGCRWSGAGLVHGPDQPVGNSEDPRDGWDGDHGRGEVVVDVPIMVDGSCCKFQLGCRGV